MGRLAGPLRSLLAIVSVVLILHACQDSSEPTTPSFSPTKPPRTLTVTGVGTGVGTVTAPDVGETGPLLCAIAAGTYDPTDCTRTYGWKSTVVLTATAGSGSTFTGWSGACSGTSPTCRLTMVQSKNVKASFSGQGSVSYTLNLAGKGTGTGTAKSQSGLTPAINCSISAGTPTGTCSGSYTSGTVVTLTAAATVGTFDGWSGDCSGTALCTLTMAANHTVTVSFTAPPGPEATVGKWSPPAATPVIGLHLSYLINGRTLLWGHGGEPQIWDPSGGGFTQVADATCNGSTCELFCSGHTFLSDGRLLVAGGHNETLGDGNGLKQASIFNGSSWSATASMAYARWYPTLVELENGDVVALSGSQDPSLKAAIPERYNGSTWTALTGASLALSLYPPAFVEPKNGWIFVAGPTVLSRYLKPGGSGAWTTTGLGNGGNRVGPSRDYGSAVMLDSKVLYVGGGGRVCPDVPLNTAEKIDLAAGTPTWTSAASMMFHRRQTNATVLPDGKVLVTGGTSACGATNESGAVFAAEAWDPATGQWSTWASASVVRVYHSTALLLPDGRVLSTGSGDGGGTTQQYSYEIFSPPYLFKGERPTYNLASTAMHYGQPFSVTTADAASITKVTIIRLSSTTHAFNAGQRLNTLSFVKAADGQSLTLTAPTTGRKAPPGPYMLFILNDKGVPSVAQTILLSP